MCLEEGQIVHSQYVELRFETDVTTCERMGNQDGEKASKLLWKTKRLVVSVPTICFRYLYGQV